MKRKTAIVTVSYLLTGLFMLGLFASLKKAEAAFATRAGRYQAELAFEELCAAVGELDVTLEKCALATSPGLTASLCAEAWAQAASAVTALGTLGFPSQELEETARFLAMTGDYARSLTRSAASGAALPQADRENLRELSGVAAWLTGKLEEQRGTIADGLADAASTPDALRKVEQELPDFPSLTYDGVYSYDESEPAMLAGRAETGEREACLIAAAFLGQRSTAARSQGRAECEVPCWQVSVGDYTVHVSAQGGQVLQAVCARSAGETTLGLDTARAEAEKFLKSRGYDDMRETAWSTENGTLVTTWCYVQDGVRCYSDEVKLAIALDTGALAGFDATEYVENHRTRRVAQPYITAQDARAFLPAELTVEEEFLALIPSPGGQEKLCWGFLCRQADEGRCVVFCSAATGAQERIALLEEDERGLRSV